MPSFLILASGSRILNLGKMDCREIGAMATGGGEIGAMATGGGEIGAMATGGGDRHGAGRSAAA